MKNIYNIIVEFFKYNSLPWTNNKFHNDWNYGIAKSEQLTAINPYFPYTPIPIFATLIIETSLFPSPIAKHTYLTYFWTILTICAFYDGLVLHEITVFHFFIT